MFGGVLGAKIFFAIVFVVVAALGGALLLTKQRADRAADESVGRALAATQSAIQDALASRATGLQRVTAGLAQVPTYVSRIDEALRVRDGAALLDQVEEFRDQTGAAWTLLTDSDGWIQAWTLFPDVYDEDISDASFVRLALAGEPNSGTWLEPEEDGDLLFQVVGVPILDPSQTTVYGVLLAALPIDESLALELKNHTNSDVAFFALDTLGNPAVEVSTVDGYDLNAGLASAGIEFWPDYLDGLASMDADSLARVTMGSGSETLVGVAGALGNAEGAALGGYVGFRSWEQELGAFNQLQSTIVYVFGGGVGLALILSLILAGGITRPVNKLVALTHRVSEGQYTGEVTVESKDEIGQLATAFQHMIQELKSKEELVEFLSGAGGQTLAMTDDQATLPDVQQGATVPMAMASRVLEAGMMLAGRYRIKEILGAGGMGVVYRAQDTELDETVAIKTLKPEAVAADASLMDRFKQEIRLARRITHRNVVRTHDLGEEHGTYFITMEYVEGQTLKDLVQKRGKLPAWVTVTVGKQLCRALEVAHREGIVHRDIKPQNIVVDSSGFLKVMDFGIARLAAQPQGGEEGLTAVGTAIGTPDYMAPEQMLGEEVDARADLYAAGIVLYECITGQPTFSAPTIAALMVKQINDSPADPRTINPDTPDALAELVLRMLAKNREERPSSATEVIAALDELPARAG